jgi:SNF2 family DNA or RNA helicase
MRMRQIVGLAKVEPTTEYVEEWLEQHDEEKDLLAFEGQEVKIRAKPKLVVFIHHINVGTVLEGNLNTLLAARGDQPCIRLMGGLSGEDSSAIEREFRENPKRRILIASTLAAGEGKNFQFCSDAVLMERQWNPPNEEQAETRFTRPGSTASQVNVLYPVAVGTVDEYLAELVEKKRTFLATTKNKWGDASESEIMKELMSRLSTEGRRRWRP